MSNYKRYLLKNKKLRYKLPLVPSSVYKDSGWINTEEYLSTNRFEFLPYKKASNLVKKFKIETTEEFLYWKKRPKNIPSRPNLNYKNKGWKSWGDFLQSGTIAPQNLKYTYMKFEKLKKLVKKLKIKSGEEYRKAIDKKLLPTNVPRAPDNKNYAPTWKGWKDFLGTGDISAKLRNYRPFQKARTYVRSLKLKSERELRKYIKAGKIPKNIPSSPGKTYKNKGWKGMQDFLGYKKQYKHTGPRKP